MNYERFHCEKFTLIGGSVSPTTLYSEVWYVQAQRPSREVQISE